MTDNKQKLIAAAKEVKFYSDYVLPSVPMSTKHYYIWLCEFQLWMDGKGFHVCVDVLSLHGDWAYFNRGKETSFAVHFPSRPEALQAGLLKACEILNNKS